MINHTGPRNKGSRGDIQRESMPGKTGKCAGSLRPSFHPKDGDSCSSGYYSAIAVSRLSRCCYCSLEGQLYPDLALSYSFLLPFLQAFISVLYLISSL